jgi:hypothetical protein
VSFRQGGYQDRVAVVFHRLRTRTPGREGRRNRQHTADVAVEQQLAAAARDVVDRYGRVDLLVNNPAASASASFTCIPAEMFERILRVNFLGVVNGCRVFLPYLKRRSPNQILNVSKLLCVDRISRQECVCCFQSGGPYVLGMLAHGVYHAVGDLEGICSCRLLIISQAQSS